MFETAKHIFKMKKPSFIIKKLPLIVSILIIAFILNTIYQRKYWEREGSVINWDIISYYGYLPATFIYHDYTLKFIGDYKGPHKFTIWSRKIPNGGNVIMTSMGMSMVYAPFFFAGHAAAYFFDYDTGGYSEPYRLALILSSVFYLALGLFFLSKLLLRFFNPYITTWVILITVMGTNLFYYVTYSSAMPHPYSFALITMFVWYSIKWHENAKLKYSIILGLLLGIIALVRPTDIVIVFFFIFWDIKSFKELVNRVKLFIISYKSLIIIALFYLLVWAPQLLYWKSITGSWFFYSYGEENRFFFNHPMILSGLFSYRNGWLVYSPVMIFSIFGMAILIRSFKEMFIPVVFTFLIFIYLIYSWWCWWYGGAFGSRPMIDIYGLLALPLGAFFSYSLSWRKIWRWTAISISVLLFAAGIHHTDKVLHFSSHWDSMTKEAFWDSYLKRGPSPTFESKLRTADYDKARKGIYVYKGEDIEE
jgi:hypothetical protein